MPKKSKTLCVDDLRHAEYYGMQDTFDELYQKSQNGEVFENLMDLIVSRDNILLAYRNIKANKGSYTAGTDKKNITDIGSRTPDDVVKRVRFIVTGSEHGYRPKPVRRKDIPKPNGKTRPLGIPCIWDRLIQQCIKQIMEPICEAKFSNNSYGFRPNRSVEHAINRTYTMLQMMNLHYVRACAGRALPRRSRQPSACRPPGSRLRTCDCCGLRPASSRRSAHRPGPAPERRR